MSCQSSLTAVTSKLVELRTARSPRPRVEGDPKTDTRAAAAHIVGVLWASASQGLSVRELRGDRPVQGAF